VLTLLQSCARRPTPQHRRDPFRLPEVRHQFVFWAAYFWRREARVQKLSRARIFVPEKFRGCQFETKFYAVLRPFFKMVISSMSANCGTSALISWKKYTGRRERCRERRIVGY
jgi:hypothetical protein